MAARDKNISITNGSVEMASSLFTPVGRTSENRSTRLVFTFDTQFSALINKRIVFKSAGAVLLNPVDIAVETVGEVTTYSAEIPFECFDAVGSMSFSVFGDDADGRVFATKEQPLPVEGALSPTGGTAYSVHASIVSTTIAARDSAISAAEAADEATAQVLETEAAIVITDAARTLLASTDHVTAQGDHTVVIDLAENLEATYAPRLATVETGKATKTEVEVERARINSFTTLATGSTTGDAELIDGRIGADGVIYANIGGSVRGQMQALKDGLDTIEGISQEITSRNILDTRYLEGKTQNDYKYAHDAAWYININASLPFALVAGELWRTDMWVTNDGGVTVTKLVSPNYTVKFYSSSSSWTVIANVTCGGKVTLSENVPQSAYIRIALGTGTYFAYTIVGMCFYKVLSDVDFVASYDRYAQNFIKTEKNSRLETSLASMVSGNTIELSVSDIKQNNSFSFYGELNGEFDSVFVAHGKSSLYSGMFTKVDATNVYFYRYHSSDILVATVPHGLTVSEFISVTVNILQNQTADVIVSTVSGLFKCNNRWQGTRGTVSAGATCSLTSCKLSFYCSDYAKKIWAFGDSWFYDYYTARWPEIVIGYGYTDCMFDGFGGRTSLEAITSLGKCLLYGTPRKLLWCMGMNDGDSGSTINANWVSAFEQLKTICRTKGIELILCTIPTSTVVNNTPKNNNIKASGYRYVDISKAIGADESASWYVGLQDADHIHPTALGSKVIAARIIADVPEFLGL